MMRAIKRIVIHCSATKPSMNVDISVIEKWHLARNYRKVGYHFVILRDGTVQEGRKLEEIGAHVYGFNKDSIGICWVGGLDEKGKPSDNRTIEQKQNLIALVDKMRKKFPAAEVVGHRDLSPDIDGDGIVEPWEWLKACPCFHVKAEFK